MSMRKLLHVLLAAMTAAILSVSVFAFDTIEMECEDGDITGAALEFNDGNIQEKSLASGGLVVGMSGNDADMTMGTTITFSGVEISEHGIYRVILGYDTNNDSIKKVDFLIDGVRYVIEIPMDELSSAWDVEYREGSVEVELSAGAHTIAVTTSEDFNRDKSDPDAYVKSVNADYLRIEQVSKIEEPAPAAEEPVIETPPAETALAVSSAPQTFDLAAVLLTGMFTAAAAAAVAKRRAR